MFNIIKCDTCLSTQCQEHKYIQIHINNVILIYTFIYENWNLNFYIY